MKYALVILLVIDLVLVSGAIYRLFTAKPDTPPLISIPVLVSGERSAATPSSPKAPAARSGNPAAPAADTTRRDAVVDHLRGSRVGEMEETATISTTSPHGNAEYNTDKALERAASIEEGREGDLDDAKARIGKIGK